MFLHSTLVRLSCAALCWGAAAHAQTEVQISESPPALQQNSSAGLWLVGLLAQADDDSNDGASVSFGYGVGYSTWLSAFVTSSSSPADRADISTESLILAVDHRFEHVGLSFELEDWGDSGTVESQDIAAEISFFNDWFQFDLGLEQRAIDITLRVPTPGRVRSRKVPIDADGWSLGFAADAGDMLRVYYDYREYDYSRDISQLPLIQRFGLLNSSALTLANSFLSESHTLGFDIMFSNKVLSLTFGDDTSEVDNTDLSSLGLALLMPVAPRIDLEVSIGRSDSDFFEPNTWGGIGILIYGGN